MIKNLPYDKIQRMLGYADESGEPGVKKNEHDFFVFCVVLMRDKRQVLRTEEKIAEFRQKQGLPADHEFHYAVDSKKTRLAFSKFLSELDFQYLLVSIKKNDVRKNASFGRMADLVLYSFKENKISARVLMDTNPRLNKELRNKNKSYNLDAHFAERQSHACDLIQVADYVVAIHSRFFEVSE